MSEFEDGRTPLQRSAGLILNASDEEWHSHLEEVDEHYGVGERPSTEET